MKKIFEDHKGTLVFAHRGLNKREKENTLISFQAAILAGVDGIELDVHLTKDEKLVIIHDSNTLRTTGTDLNIKDHTLIEIQKADFQIPTLESVFSAFGNKILYDIEIKEDSFPDKRLAKLLCKTIKEYKLEKNVIVSSFNPLSIRSFKRQCKDIPTALIFTKGEKIPKILQKGLGRLISHPNLLKPGYDIRDYAIKRFKSRYPLCIWCVDDKNEFSKLQKMGIKMVITNDAELLLKN